ncbi:Alpha-L-Iduronidase [Manis pentadactyla]|nr:Alpha-L-Iduronidase [Manis pentadactyla]
MAPVEPPGGSATEALLRPARLALAEAATDAFGHSQEVCPCGYNHDLFNHTDKHPWKLCLTYRTLDFVEVNKLQNILIADVVSDYAYKAFF